MVGFVFSALFTTRAADLSTEAANFFCVLAVAGHHVSSQLADVRTVQIKLDALGHHLYVVFVETRSCARLADNRTVATGLDA